MTRAADRLIAEYLAAMPESVRSWLRGELVRLLRRAQVEAGSEPAAQYLLIAAIGPLTRQEAMEKRARTKRPSKRRVKGKLGGQNVTLDVPAGMVEEVAE